jgi:hypothetical protein
MPLFGRATLRLADEMELGASLVLPSREKLLNRDPYPRLQQAFLNSVDACDAAIFVGSSLRDVHIRSAANDVARSGRPVVVVNRRGSDLGVSGALPVAQTASQFLVSTLPVALSEPDPIATIRRVSLAVTPMTPGLFGVLRCVFDRHADPIARCSAIETCEEHGIVFDQSLMSRLFADDAVTVARHALGLVQPQQPDIRSVAAACRHSADPLFRDELALLEQTLGL